LGELRRLALTGERNEDTNLANAVGNAVVDVARDNTVRRRERSRTAHAQVLTDRRDQLFHLRIDRVPLARVLGGQQLLEAAAGTQCQRSDLAHRALERLVAGNEVRLRV